MSSIFLKNKSHNQRLQVDAQTAARHQAAPLKIEYEIFRRSKNLHVDMQSTPYYLFCNIRNSYLDFIEK